jgi:hypothetical protein
LSTEEAAAAAAAPFAACENVSAAEAYEGGEAAEAAEAGICIASLPPAVDEEVTTPAEALSEAEAALAFLKKPVAYRMRESRLPATASFLSLGGGGL